MSEINIFFGDSDAEEMLLATMMGSNFEIAVECADQLFENSFGSPEHQDVFRAIRRLIDAGEVPDPFSVIRSIEADGEAVMTSDVRNTVLKLSEAPYVAAARKRYLSSVAASSLRRSLLMVSQDISRMAQDPTVDPVDLQTKTEDQVYQLRDEGTHRQDFVKAGDLAAQAISDLTSEEVPGIPTGLHDLDRMIGRMKNGNIVVIGARPSMGKTALALTIGINAAKAGSSVGIFSLEMNPDEIAVRLMSSQGRVDGMKMNHRRGELSAEEWKRINASADTIKGWKMEVDGSSQLSVGAIRSKCQRLKARSGLDLVIVDYIQLMGGQEENRVQELSSISRQFKIMAGELGVPVIILSQLNRAAEARNEKRPSMADLRESGAIEQDADIVLLLFREDYYEKDIQTGVGEIIVAKSRNGGTGVVETAFLPQYATFTDLARDDGSF